VIPHSNRSSLLEVSRDIESSGIVGLGDDASLGENARNEAMRSHVECRVPDSDAIGCQLDSRNMCQLLGGTLFDDDVRSVGQVGV